MSATQAFADAWRVSGRKAVALVQLDFAATSLKVSTKLVSTPPNGDIWAPFVHDIHPISAPGEWGTSDVPLCTTRIVLIDKPYDLSGNKISSIPVFESVIGKPVTIWLWEENLTNFTADALVVFKGTIQDYEIKLGFVTFNLRQRTDWNVALPALTLSQSKYPRAPDEGKNAPLPIVYGNVLPPGLRPPHTPAYSLAQRRFAMARGPKGLTRGILADTGRGGASVPRIIGASHAVTSLFDPSKGTALWAELEGKLAFVNADAGTAFSLATESGLTMVDNQPALIVIDIGDIYTATNPAKNMRYLVTPTDDQYAELDYDALQRDCVINMASMSDIAILDRLECICVYSTTGSVANLTLQATRDDGGTPLSIAMPTAATPTLLSTGSLPTGAQPFIYGWGDFNHYRARAFYNGVAFGGKAKIYLLAFMATVFLRRNIKTAAFNVERTKKRPTFRNRSSNSKNPPNISDKWDSYTVLDETPAVTELLGDYHWNIQGMGDGSPLITGVPGALLVGIPDIFAHILGKYASQVDGVNIQGGVSGELGSFRKARAFYYTWHKKVMEYALTISETTDMMTVLSWIAASSTAFIYIDRLTDKFHFVPWDKNAPTDWFFTFRPREVVESVPECSILSASQMVTGIRLRYGYDARNGEFDQETSVGVERSSAGHAYSNRRDQMTRIIASENDRINFLANAVTYTATLTASNYASPMALANQVQLRMRAADTGANSYWVSYGGWVSISYNDKIDFAVSAVNYTATIEAGTYDMEGLAVAVAAALNSVGPGGFSCSYSRATLKFTISRATAFTLRNETGPSKLTSVMGTLGFIFSDINSVTSYTGTRNCEDLKYKISSDFYTFDILWQTGADGSESALPRCAASPLGFDPRYDSVGGLSSHVGLTPCGSREWDLNQLETRYGKRRDASFEARAIYDGEVALETRNRLTDLYSTERLKVTFTTEHAPDIERGRVFEFSDDFDALLLYPLYGSDGTWAGKRFMVVETEQHLGPTSYLTRIVAYSL